MIIGYWGDDKSCKTTLALTSPRPILYQEFDIGGLDRASRNIGDNKILDWVRDGSIITKSYVMPFQLGSLDPVKNIIRPSKIVVGIKELWYQWLGDFMKALKDDNILSIVIDTGTLLWEVTNTGYLQEKQELQMPLRVDGMGKDGKPLRTQLLQIEYKEPNIRMRSIIYQAKAHHKHLIMTHHSRDEYGLIKQRDGTMGEGKTGKKERNGWTALGDGADIIAHCYIREETKLDENGKQMLLNGKRAMNRVPYCQVDLAEVQELIGVEFREPTFDVIQESIDLVKGGE